jgi:hypothetical protein
MVVKLIILARVVFQYFNSYAIRSAFIQSFESKYFNSYAIRSAFIQSFESKYLNSYTIRSAFIQFFESKYYIRTLCTKLHVILNVVELLVEFDANINRI